MQCKHTLKPACFSRYPAICSHQLKAHLPLKHPPATPPPRLTTVCVKSCGFTAVQEIHFLFGHALASNATAHTFRSDTSESINQSYFSLSCWIKGELACFLHLLTFHSAGFHMRVSAKQSFFFFYPKSFNIMNIFNMASGLENEKRIMRCWTRYCKIFCIHLIKKLHFLFVAEPR